MPKIKDLMESALWYERTRRILVRDYGKDADLMADLIAATSAHVPIQQNLRLAKEVYKRYCLFDDWQTMPGLIPGHRLNIARALDKEPLSGLKVRAFAENLKGNMNAITIDTAICQYFNYLPYLKRKKLRNHEYKYLSKKIKRNAKRHGLKPAEYQAIIWVIVRGNKNAILSLFDGTEDEGYRT
jgi:hypothetical protein